MIEAEAQRSNAAGVVAQRRGTSLMNLAMKRSWLAALDIAASYAKLEEKLPSRVSQR